MKPSPEELTRAIAHASLNIAVAASGFEVATFRLQDATFEIDKLRITLDAYDNRDQK